MKTPRPTMHQLLSHYYIDRHHQYPGSKKAMETKKTLLWALKKCLKVEANLNKTALTVAQKSVRGKFNSVSAVNQALFQAVHIQAQVHTEN